MAHLSVNAQTTVKHTNLLWVNYQNVTELTKKWSVLTDVQFRTKDFVNEWILFAARSGLSYKLDDKFSVAAGFTWFGSMQYVTDKKFIKNEYRPWQDISFLKKETGRFDLNQRLRLEERFLQLVKNGEKTSDYETVLRLRYKLDYQKYLKNKRWCIKIGNEVMVNTTYMKDNRFFDQNRSFVGVGFQKTKNLQLQLQYMKIWQWKGSNKTLEDQNVVRVNFFNQLSFLHREKQ